MNLEDMARRCALAAVIGWCGIASGHAQERTTRYRHIAATAHVPTEAAQERRRAPRALTINPRQQKPAPADEADDDIYLDGPIRYNSIRTFDPAPYADSGKQYPLGLDGIGGYGSDLGVSAGHDSAIYDRGF